MLDNAFNKFSGIGSFILSCGFRIFLSATLAWFVYFAAMKYLVRHFAFWLGVAALVIYCLTLSSGMTIASLDLSAKLCGWDWRPWIGQPLLWVLTLPLRVLPEAWVPVGLNLFAAGCAAGVLGLLAASLELLPWSIPPLKVSGWRFRLPILLALIVCGLEINFWQHATQATGEMLGLLLFAGSLWCLLKSRAHQDIRWLHIAALVWGLGMAENWMMMLAWPLMIAIVWALHRFEFWNWRFLLRLAGWGAAGYSIVLLPPLINGVLPNSPLSFKDAWLTAGEQIWHTWQGLFVYFVVIHRATGLILLGFYLLPLLSLAWILCRHEDEPANQPTLDQLQIFLFRVLRFGLLLACLWVALDPVPGPRNILKNQIQFAQPLLSFDYLIALGAGLLAGNLLLAGQRKTTPTPRPIYLDYLFFWQERVTPVLIAFASIAITTLLISRNFSPVTQANRFPLKQYGEFIGRSLPSGGGVVLSDFSDRLAVFREAQAHHPEWRGWVPVEVGALTLPEYRSWLARRYPEISVPAPGRRDLGPAELRTWIDRLASSNRVYYLQWSSGFLFEAFYLEPAGAVYQLKPFVTDTVRPPPLAREIISENQKIWNEAQSQIEALNQSAKKIPSPLAARIAAELNLAPPPFPQGDLLRSWYSMALNGWGVQLQWAGQFAEARNRFADAIVLSQTNWIARFNLLCNSNLQAGGAMNIAAAEKLSEKIPGIGAAKSLLGRFGPVDEPAFCYTLGNIFSTAKLPRLAMQQFERCAELAPAETAPKFSLISLYAHTGLSGRATNMIEFVRSETRNLPLISEERLRLALAEAEFHWLQKNPERAREIVDELIGIHSENILGLESVVKQIISFRDFVSADAQFSRHLERSPNNPFLLHTRSELLIQCGKPEAAIAGLNRVLELTNYPPARFNRAIAYLRVSDFAAAQRDFLALTNAALDAPAIEFGLAESALGFGETNMAVQYLKKSLSRTPKNSPAWEKITSKLNQLTPGSE